MFVKKNIPNFITCLRIIGTILLLFVPPLEMQFFIVYVLTGITDALDGFLARKLKVSTPFGAKLDSASDLMFYAVLIVMIRPELWKRLHPSIWYAVGATVAIRVFCYSYVAVKYKCFDSMHTYLNKLTGLAVFCVPFALLTSVEDLLCWLVVGIAALASVEELVMQLLSKKYHAGKKSIFQMLR